MKARKTPRNIYTRLHHRPIRYQWVGEDGCVCHGSTVVSAQNRSGLKTALTRFWLQHTNVTPEIGI